MADIAFDRIAGLLRRLLGVPITLVSLVDREQQVNPGQSGLPDPWCDSRAIPLSHSICQHVVRSGDPLVVRDARTHPLLHDHAAVRDSGAVGYAGFPLHDLAGRVVGSLCAIDTEPHDWSDDEIGLISDLAITCSTELQLRQAAASAREAQDRTSVLLELSETLSDTLTTVEVSHAVSRLATERLGASFGGITILDAAAGTLTYVDLSTFPAQVRDGFGSFPLTRATPSADVVTTRTSLFFESVDQLRLSYPVAAQRLELAGAQASGFLALRVADRIVGTLCILWDHPRTISEADRALLNGLSRYAAQAVEHALLLSDRREVAETLQAEMLPTLPDIGWVELTGRYRPARVSESVGGDWYDAFAMSDHELAISVGDVEGHDTRAAAVMGRMRATLRGLCLTMPGAPSDVLEALDDVLGALPPGRYATGILGTLRRDGAETTLAWSNAGHPPPLLIAPGRPPVFADEAASPPLGLGLRSVLRRTHTMPLPAGSSLLLYTDGLVERRRADINDMLQALAESVDRHRDLPLPELVDAVLEDMMDVRQADDVVLFGLRTT